MSGLRPHSPIIRSPPTTRDRLLHYSGVTSMILDIPINGGPE
jgi:hypothetical protein